jgi:hypothetical protein
MKKILILLIFWQSTLTATTPNIGTIVTDAQESLRYDPFDYAGYLTVTSTEECNLDIVDKKLSRDFGG